MKAVSLIFISLIIGSFAEAVTLDCSEGVQIDFVSDQAIAKFANKSQFQGHLLESQHSYAEYTFNGWNLRGAPMDSATLTVGAELFIAGQGTVDVISSNEGYVFADKYQCKVRR